MSFARTLSAAEGSASGQGISGNGAASTRLQAALPVPPEEEAGLHSDSVGELTYTVSEAIDHIGFGRFQTYLLGYAGLAWAADACEMMLLSFVGPAVRCGWGLSPGQESMLTSAVFLGTMLGVSSWGAIADGLGRRRGFAATALFIFAFGILSALSPNYVALLAFRGVVGIGLGGVPVVYTLFTEFCPTDRRGLWLVVLQSFWTVGTMAEAALASQILIPWGWRWLLGVSALPFVALLLLYPLVPESPHWLAVSGDVAGADAVLRRMAAVNGAQLPPGRLECPAGLSATSASGSKAPPPSQLPTPASVRRRLADGAAELRRMGGHLFSPALRSTTLLLQVVWFANAVVYYGLVLLVTTLHTGGGGKSPCLPGGIPNLTPSDFNAIFITSIAEVPGLVVAGLAVELLGRKTPIAAGLVISGGAILALQADPSTALMFAARAGSMGAFTVLFLYTPEVYPTSIRSVGTGLANSMARLGSIVSPFVAVVLVRNGYTTLAEDLLAAACLLAALCTIALPIETKGRALTALPESDRLPDPENEPLRSSQQPQSTER